MLRGYLEEFLNFSQIFLQFLLKGINFAASIA